MKCRDERVVKVTATAKSHRGTKGTRVYGGVLGKCVQKAKHYKEERMISVYYA